MPRTSYLPSVEKRLVLEPAEAAPVAALPDALSDAFPHPPFQPARRRAGASGTPCQTGWRLVRPTATRRASRSSRPKRLDCCKQRRRCLMRIASLVRSSCFGRTSTLRQQCGEAASAHRELMASRHARDHVALNARADAYTSDAIERRQLELSARRRAADERAAAASRDAASRRGGGVVTSERQMVRRRPLGRAMAAIAAAAAERRARGWALAVVLGRSTAVLHRTLLLGRLVSRMASTSRREQCVRTLQRRFRERRAISLQIARDAAARRLLLILSCWQLRRQLLAARAASIVVRSLPSIRLCKRAPQRRRASVGSWRQPRSGLRKCGSAASTGQQR
jgi:hypothetical protein